MTDVSFTFLENVNIGDVKAASISISEEFMAIGCPDCNSLYGRFEVRNVNGSTVLYSYVGNDEIFKYGDSIEIITHSNYSQVFVTSENIASETNKQYYLDILTIVTTSDDSGYLYYLEQRAIA